MSETSIPLRANKTLAKKITKNKPKKQMSHVPHLRTKEAHVGGS
jgi:hypothetical protein